MRVLVTCSGAASHFTPLAPFVAALARRDDEMLVIVPLALAAMVEATGHPYRIAADAPAREKEAIWERVPFVSPDEASVLVNREIFGRLNTAAMLPTLEDACSRWRPDFVLREPCEYAAAIAADRRGIRHAQVAISLAELEASCLSLVSPVLEQYGIGVVERIRSAPYLTRFPASLDPSPFNVTQRFRETTDRSGGRHEPLPDWWEGDKAPLIYVTFGTVTGGLPIAPAIYRAALEAVGGLPARVLLTIGRTADKALLGPIPANVHVEAWVPQDDVLAEAAVVVCHGGSGTTFGALAAGVPLVIVPMFADQPVNARLVSTAGAGLVVTSTDPRSMESISKVLQGEVPRLRAAVETVLADESYHQAAHRIEEEMHSLPDIEDVLGTFDT